MDVNDLKKILKGPLKAEIIKQDGAEWAECSYCDRTFGVYYLGDEEIDTLVFSYISEAPIPHLSLQDLNKFHSDAHVGRVFWNEEGYLNLNAKLHSPLRELQPKTLVGFIEAWLDDFDYILPVLHANNE